MSIPATSSDPQRPRAAPKQPDTDPLLSAGSGWVCLLAFAVALAAGLFIQLVLLPHILPGLHAGHGLLRGGDWIGFHEDGVALAQQIAQHGWQAFELRPRGQAPIGITAAVYVLTGIHEPWILVPIQAAVFAIAVVGLFNICRSIAPVRNSAIAAGLMVVFPSTVLLYAQIHKDVWALAGTLWILFAILTYTRTRTWSWRQHAALLAITVAGIGLVWLVRAYALQIVLLGLITAVLLFVVSNLLSAAFGGAAKPWRDMGGIAICIMLVFAGAVDSPARLAQHVSPQIAKAIAAPNVVEGDRPVFEPILLPPNVIATLNSEQKRLYGEQSRIDFVKTLNPQQTASWKQYQVGVNAIVSALTPAAEVAPSWVPAPVRERLTVLINLRRGEALSAVSAGSGIDYEVPIRDVWDMIRYVPRALQIALFAPFPDTWFRHGVSPGASIMLRLAAVEMSIAYVALLGFVPLLLFSSAADRMKILFLCSFALPILCLLGITIPNVGTLLRMRYGYWYVMLGLGVAGWGLALERWRRWQSGKTIASPAATA